MTEAMGVPKRRSAIALNKRHLTITAYSEYVAQHSAPYVGAAEAGPLPASSTAEAPAEYTVPWCHQCEKLPICEQRHLPETWA